MICNQGNNHFTEINTVVLPPVNLPAHKLKLTDFARWKKRSNYYLIFHTIRQHSAALAYCSQLLKKYVLEGKERKEEQKSFSPAIKKTVALLRSVYGNDTDAYHFIFSDYRFQENLEDQYKLLSLYFADGFQWLPTQYLANVLIMSSTPLQIHALRQLIYFAGERKGEVSLNPLVLDDKAHDDDDEKATPFLKELGESQKLLRDLGLMPAELSEEKINYQIQEIQSLISKLQKLPRRESRCCIKSFLIVIIAAVVFVVLSYFINQSNIQDRVSMLESDVWWRCSSNGYSAVSVIDIKPSLYKGECSRVENYTRTTECDQLCDAYGNIIFPRWLFSLDYWSLSITGTLILARIITYIKSYTSSPVPINVPDAVLEKINRFLQNTSQLPLIKGSDDFLDMKDALSKLKKRKEVLESFSYTASTDEEKFPSVSSFSITTTPTPRNARYDRQKHANSMLEPLLTS
jgi:hypothetical protein